MIIVKEESKTIGWSKIKIYWKWILYWIATQPERHLYNMGMIRGYHCLGYRKEFCGRTYYYDSTRSPKKNFLCKKEFMQIANIK